MFVATVNKSGQVFNPYTKGTYTKGTCSCSCILYKKKCENDSNTDPNP